MIKQSSSRSLCGGITLFARASTVARVVAWLVLGCLVANATSAADAPELNVLFIGNSFTARHELTRVIKSLAEEGQPGLRFNVTTVIYGGRTLAHHWELQTPNFIRQATIRPAEVQASITLLKGELEQRRQAEQRDHEKTDAEIFNPIRRQNYAPTLRQNRSGVNRANMTVAIDGVENHALHQKPS